MPSVSTVTAQTYVCNIIYHPLQFPAPAGNTASYAFIPPLPAAGLNPGDRLDFTFSPSPDVKILGKLDQAVLVAGYKDAHVSMESSPFHNDANNIDIHSFPTLTIGTRPGRWGFTVVFSVVAPAIDLDKTSTHFYFLPDPEVVVRPM